MFAWRLCRRPHADLTGEGARRFGGRWNSVGLPVVYLAKHPALAALEVRVHLDLPFDLLPADFTLMRITAPNQPDRLLTMPEDTVAIGDAWLKEAASLMLSVPSILVPHAWNILLNPRHPEAGKVEVLGLEPFQFDPCLWRPLASES